MLGSHNMDGMREVAQDDDMDEEVGNEDDAHVHDEVHGDWALVHGDLALVHGD